VVIVVIIISGLFDDVVSSSDSPVLNGRMINK
jgi:hypothetical protein